MLDDKKIVVVMPAYNAAHVLHKTYAEIPASVVDDVILVDDGSSDSTAETARELGIEHIVTHDRNLGYGANQKTCYHEAMARGADVVVMVHADYQYTPKLVLAMASMIVADVYDCVLGSRILGPGALTGGMPRYKYVANRALTAFQNLVIDHKLSEFHTGFRAYSRTLLESLPLDANADDFVFDNQVLAQAIYAGYRIGEISCPTRYDADSSSVGFAEAVRYGIGVVRTSFEFRLHAWGVLRSPLFAPLDRQSP